MERLSRRSVLCASLGAATAGMLARPYIANAEAKTASAWWAQGFIPEEDVALRQVMADYGKASGNVIEPTIIPFAPLRQKIISAITSGVVPDLIDASPLEVVPEQAWHGRLVDVSDVVEKLTPRAVPNALLGAKCYNSVEKRRSYYGIPYKASVRPFHIWGSLVEKAGYKRADIPTRWDDFIDFFRPVQDKLRAQGMRHTYAAGFVLSTVGGDVNSTFLQFTVAYGGERLVTPDGKLHVNDPQVRAAVLKSLGKLTALYKDGYNPPSSLNWNDADDNNAFHSKLCVMDLDGTLSTEVAMLRRQREEYYHEVITHGMPLSNDGKPVKSVYPTNLTFIPNGAKNVAVAKEFMQFLLQPEVNDAYLKAGLGRYLPIFPELVNDPWWRDPKQDPHRPPYVAEGFDKPTIPWFWVFNPAYAQVETEHVWGQAIAKIVSSGVAPEQATDDALTRVEQIFANYRIGT